MFAHSYPGLSVEKVTWDAYWMLVRRADERESDDDVKAKARRLARDVQFATQLRKAIGISNG